MRQNKEPSAKPAANAPPERVDGGLYQALSGVKVLDLSHVLAGPYATHVLAQLGADVIKVERPGTGDSMRGLSEPSGQTALAPNFIGANAAKRSLALDLKTPAGRKVLERLVSDADVFVENFRPGKMAGLGFGPDRLTALNPDIVCCSISAWGQQGDLSPQGGFDHVMQAATGMMLMQGDQADAPPVKVGFPVIDMATGMQAALAILTGLIRRRAGFAGVLHLDVSMADAALFLMAPMAVQHLFGAPLPHRVGNRGFADSPGSGVFRTRDGWLATGANTLGLFDALCRVLGRPELASAPEYLKSRPDAPGDMLFRLATDRLMAEMETVFSSHRATEWEARLLKAGVPASVVRSLPDYLDGPYGTTGGATLPVSQGNDQRGGILGAGFRCNGQIVGRVRPAPELGQDTETILQSLGYTDAEIMEMRRRKEVA